MAALLLASCSYRFPHACDRHGGINYALHGMYHCNDGTEVGAGWLWVHHLKEAP